jgi:hypothetical protein
MGRINLMADAAAGPLALANICVTISSHAVLKCGTSRSDTASSHCFHAGFTSFRIRRSAMGIAAVAVRQLSRKEVSATNAVCSTVVSGSLPTTTPINGSIGLRDMVTLISHTSKPSTMDKRQW